MKVEREFAGFALPFTVGVLLTAYAGAIFCGQSSYIHFISLLLIFCIVTLLFNREELDCDTYIQRGLIALVALACGALSAATAISLFDMPENRFEVFFSNIGLGMQTMIDGIPFASEETSALIKALLTGERGGLTADVKSAFRDSGASHILALSGLHLGIIYGLLSKFLSLFGNSQILRVLRSLLIICACGLYTLATGAGDSLLRAFIFISLRELAKITGRYHGLGQILLTSLVIQLVIDPLAIRSVSFQLSYAAMAGVAFVYPWLQGFWDRAADFFRIRAFDTADMAETSYGLKSGEVVSGIGGLIIHPTRWIWDTVTLSISCQMTTAPLAYVYFGTFPLHFMLTNLLTLPLIGLLIPAAMLVLVFSSLGCCPMLLVHATEWLASTLIWILEVISTM